jgi:hypothetical protein
MPTLLRRSVSASARACPGRSSSGLAALRGLHLDRPCAPAVIWQLEEARTQQDQLNQSVHTSRGTPGLYSYVGPTVFPEPLFDAVFYPDYNEDKAIYYKSRLARCGSSGPPRRRAGGRRGSSRTRLSSWLSPASRPVAPLPLAIPAVMLGAASGSRPTCDCSAEPAGRLSRLRDQLGLRPSRGEVAVRCVRPVSPHVRSEFSSPRYAWRG